MRDIAIYGAGGFGREVACMINEINVRESVWNLVGFFDDGLPKGTAVGHWGIVLGDCATLNSWPSLLSIAVCIGAPVTLRKVVECITNPLIDFPNLIAPDFKIADPFTFSIGHGNIIKSFCVVTTNVRIGNFNVFNGSVSLGHDASIEDFNVFMPGAVISGEVRIGNNNLFGVNSIVIQQIRIGDGVRLSPGSVLLSKPKDANLYIGNPAKKMKY